MPAQAGIFSPVFLVMPAQAGISCNELMSERPETGLRRGDA